MSERKRLSDKERDGWVDRWREKENIRIQVEGECV